MKKISFDIKSRYKFDIIQNNHSTFPYKYRANFKEFKGYEMLPPEGG